MTTVKKLTEKEIRKIIREHADERGCRYRISSTNGEVSYYGTMTNSNNIGWHFKSWDAEEWANDILEGRA